MVKPAKIGYVKGRGLGLVYIGKGLKTAQSNRTRPILQRFVFSPEVTCNRRNDASANMSVPENTVFSTIQKVFGIGLVVPEG